ncbi:glycosyltransferase [Selenomonas ruminantium]|uniref:glycosyltransferase n=1 Tax=Selenomonas ruminantium TaxID=971 RepID=UPI0026F124EA|nr:glycosyltransferase [Selenomonas ruminantium]
MKTEIKILQIGMTHNVGGMESYLMSQYRHLKKVKYDFLNITGEKEIAFREEIEKQSKIYSVPTRHLHPLKHYWAMFILFLKIHKQYDGVVLNTCDLSYMFPLLLAKIFRVPMRIIHSHNAGNEMRMSFARRRLMQLNKFIMNKSVNGRWACSNIAGKFMFGNKKYEVICNAIDVNKFLFNENIREKYRKKLDLENKFVLGNVARFSYQKNHGFLIKVFYEIQKKYPESVLLLVGAFDKDDEYYLNIMDLIKKYRIINKVFFLGPRSDVSDLYQAMDCLVMPSLFEGLCISAIEAQAAGLPCVCSNGLPDEAEITDIFHRLDLSDSINKWADLILSYKNKKREDMRESIRIAGYDIDNQIDRVENMFVTRCI